MLAVKRKGIEAVMVIVLFLLETTVFHYFEIASVKPNLLLILTASFGFMEGKREGMYVGVLSGFLLDICFGQYIGLIYVFQFMLQSDFHFPYYLGHLIIPEMLYTVILTLIVYQIILRINRKLVEEEKRSASRFV